MKNKPIFSFVIGVLASMVAISPVKGAADPDPEKVFSFLQRRYEAMQLTPEDRGAAEQALSTLSPSDRDSSLDAREKAVEILTSIELANSKPEPAVRQSVWAKLMYLGARTTNDGSMELDPNRLYYGLD